MTEERIRDPCRRSAGGAAKRVPKGRAGWQNVQARAAACSRSSSEDGSKMIINSHGAGARKSGFDAKSGRFSFRQDGAHGAGHARRHGIVRSGGIQARLAAGRHACGYLERGIRGRSSAPLARFLAGANSR